jgi:hypothetical protein
MTSLTDQFLSRLRGGAQPMSESLTPPTTSLTQSGDNSNGASSNEPTPDNNMNNLFSDFLPKKAANNSWAEIAGTAFGLIAVGVVSLLLGGLVIHWILTGIGIGSLTYGQVVGLLAIWQIIKPSSK